MKKTLAFLVAAVLVATALCACLTVSAASTNLALEATFIGADPTVGNQYTDKYNAKLNDGKAETEANWSEKPGEWFGFYYNASYPSNAVVTDDGMALATFTVELKEAANVENIRIHTITSAAYDSNGVVAPITLTVEASADNAAWATLATLNAKDGDFDKYDDIDWVEIDGGKDAAKYIRISIKFRGYTFMLNEVEVLGAYANGETSGEETSTETPAVSKNIALGKTYTGAEPSSHPNNVRYNGKLTDGVAKETLSDLVEGDWFAFYHNDGADGINAPDKVGTIVIDLEEVSAISSVKINTFVGNMWGILAPESIKVEYSEDGKAYNTLEEKTFTSPETTTDEAGNKVEIDKVEFAEFKGEAAVNARYIKVTVKLNGIFAFLNEVEVWSAGTPASGETSNETSSTESTGSASSEATGSTSKPAAGDAGLLGFAILAVVSVAGVAVASKARR